MIEIALPLVRFGDSFDRGAAFHQISSEAFAGQKISYRTPTAGEPDLIPDPCAVVHRGEVVFMNKVAEVSRDHHIAEVTVGTQLIDPAGMPEHAERATWQGHCFAFAQQAGGDSTLSVCP